MQHDDVKTGDALYIHSPKTGYLKAWAGEDSTEFGFSALFKVAINSAELPGVSNMTINVNSWDVWLADNPEVLKRIAETYIQPEWTR